MKLFKEHPASVGETYFEHMGCASYFAGRMFVASICCFLHGFFPFLFQATGKRTITDLHERMVTHRHKDHRTAGMAPTLEPAE
ncbi:MAG: DUF6356 family protein [Pseudomonadota bacterium]